MSHTKPCVCSHVWWVATQRLHDAKKAAKEISTLKKIEELERLAVGAEQPHKGSGKGKKRSPPSSDSDDSSSDSDSSTSSGTSSNEEVSTAAVPQSTATGASEVFQQYLQEKAEIASAELRGFNLNKRLLQTPGSAAPPPKKKKSKKKKKKKKKKESKSHKNKGKSSKKKSKKTKGSED